VRKTRSVSSLRWSKANNNRVAEIGRRYHVEKSYPDAPRSFIDTLVKLREIKNDIMKGTNAT